MQSWSAGNVHEGGTSLQVRRPCERLLELHADGVATGLCVREGPCSLLGVAVAQRRIETGCADGPHGWTLGSLAAVVLGLLTGGLWAC